MVANNLVRYVGCGILLEMHATNYFSTNILLWRKSAWNPKFKLYPTPCGNETPTILLRWQQSRYPVIVYIRAMVLVIKVYIVLAQYNSDIINLNKVQTLDI